MENQTDRQVYEYAQRMEPRVPLGFQWDHFKYTAKIAFERVTKFHGVRLSPFATMIRDMPDGTVEFIARAKVID